jgi:hypothetical protein
MLPPKPCSPLRPPHLHENSHELKHPQVKKKPPCKQTSDPMLPRAQCLAPKYPNAPKNIKETIMDVNMFGVIMEHMIIREFDTIFIFTINDY